MPTARRTDLRLRTLAAPLALALLLAACAGPELVQPPPAEPVPAATEVAPAAPVVPAEPEAPVTEVGTVREVPTPEAIPLEAAPGPEPLPPDEEIVPRPGCRLAADPITCEKRHRASERALAECQGIDPRLKGDCMRDAMVRAEDCSRSRSVALCESRKYAYDTCRGTYGKERRQCLVDAMPLDDCSKAKVQNAIDRCEVSKKALEVCKIFEEGPDRRTCLYTEMQPMLEEIERERAKEKKAD